LTPSPRSAAGRDSHDNALAESTIGLSTAELVYRWGFWRTVEQREFALFEYLDWWNHRRLHGERHDPTGREGSDLLPSAAGTRHGRSQ